MPKYKQANVLITGLNSRKKINTNYAFAQNFPCAFTERHLMNDYEAFLDVKIRKIYFLFWVMLFGFANKKLGNKKNPFCV